ncbi:prepilin-type N-terminal cleavage/methylation domain-containing protein [bacterium]|nr:prepilin-type N-terminal cleavage/methylation domain-containing protein [bacterium]
MLHVKNQIKKGFTLIELLIVMAIIGLLSTILLPNIAGAQNRAKEAAVKAIVYNTQTELESYQIDNFTYPDGTNISLKELLDIMNLSKIPKNPFTGLEYSIDDAAGQIIYSYDDSTGKYTLTAHKRDGLTELFNLTNN